MQSAQRNRSLALILIASMLAACGDDNDTPEQASNTPATTPVVTPVVTPSTPPTAGTQPGGPKLLGTPANQVQAGQPYSFQPTIANASGTAPRFSVVNRPAWLRFDTTTGRLSGTPTEADVGTYANITITVSNGAQSYDLGPFAISVVSVGQRSITLSWYPPTQNEDGSPLTNLGGYRIRYGQSSGAYSKVVSLNNAGLTAYTLDGLVPGTYYLVLSAFDAAGTESGYSAEARVRLN
jgi:hypothetical protein